MKGGREAREEWEIGETPEWDWDWVSAEMGNGWEREGRGGEGMVGWRGEGRGKRGDTRYMNEEAFKT